VRQFAGRKGEIWGAESGAAQLFMVKIDPLRSRGE
jgi:streptogramin lyase